MKMKSTMKPIVFILIVGMFASVLAQGGGSYTLYGDIKVDDRKVTEKVPMSLSVVLYTLGNYVLGRQTVPSGGRYRFNNLRQGEYIVAVEVDNSEIARVQVTLAGASGSDIKQDLEFEWNPGPGGSSKPKTVSSEDLYKRTSNNESLFTKAQAAFDKKKYADAATLFKQLVESDPQDFQAWTELGTTYLLSEKLEEAENAYSKAIEVRPKFSLALLNLGRVRVLQKKFDKAIEPLTVAVEVQPESADAHYYLGEAYLQTKQGSKAVGHLTEAARLGRVEAHLRLATLYNLVGMKDKAALEYEQFLKKKPDYPERKKLEQYISENKKS
jgi:tetratricopeptide (TPR) repeat protein